ncbi:HK97 gp10 family phage protein [Psychrobacter sp. APC 3426]|uniref:HK97-gp10 family putative phage morphogenesis protein n=1 Tax=Psychrobacter sp. APC 3426 TaxID=3035177 RepID=UPI0025B293B2|nr:HK97-gp10 family putative phage morphogenesis protein [Psychrobacter sp. APC 3426]MDN3397693.1 HK97 gp10 family phage protein [Psychrobacter sp. APC 3426]
MTNEIEGLDEVIAKLRALGKPRKVKNAATRSSRKAMNIVKKAAIQNAKALDDKDSPRRIWKNIVTQAGKTKGSDKVMMKVGVKGGAKKYAATRVNRRANRAGRTYATQGDKKNPGGDTWYWRLLEFGSAANSATPFLRPAISNNKDAVEAEFKRSFSEELDKEIAKL